MTNAVSNPPNARLPALSVPGVTVFPHAEEFGVDIREEVLLREYRISALNDDWKSVGGATVEIVMPTLCALRNMLTGSGVLKWSHTGDFTATANAGTLTLNLYSETTPGVGTTLLFTHPVALTGTAGAGTGYFQWDLEIRPLAMGDGTFVQWITSKLTYLRNGADTEQTIVQRTRTTINFGAADLLLKTSYVKTNAATWIVDVAQVYATITAPRSGI